MKNNYEKPGVTEIGRAQDIILGFKVLWEPYDSSSDDRYFLWFMDDDE